VGRSATLGSVPPSALLALVVSLVLTLATDQARAQSSDCEPLREVHPLPGEALPVDGAIWDICYYVARGDRAAALPDQVCAVPKLSDAQGRPIELKLEMRADGPPTRLISRYRPVTALQAGATYRLDPGVFSKPGEARDVHVIEATEAAPPAPLLQALDYSVAGSQAEARFRFAPFVGLLVKDLGAQGSVSQAAIDVVHVGVDDDPRPTLLLERTPCRENFAAQPGASTLLRFGVFDLAGHFSGWGESMAVQFPRTDTAYPATDGAADGEDGGASGCTLCAPESAPRAGVALLGCALALLSRRVSAAPLQRGRRRLRRDAVRSASAAGGGQPGAAG
jgi:hypothetical protein